MPIVSKLLAANAGCDPSKAGINLQDCYLLNDSQTVKSVYSSPSVLINLLVQYAFIAGGLIFFFLLLYAGFLHLSESRKGQERAKEILETALIGFMIMFAAFWIIQIIQVITGAQILSFKP